MGSDLEAYCRQINTRMTIIRMQQRSRNTLNRVFELNIHEYCGATTQVLWGRITSKFTGWPQKASQPLIKRCD